MMVSFYLRFVVLVVFGLIMVPSFRAFAAENEVDQMLNVESSVQKAEAKQSTAKVPELPAAKPAREEKAVPVQEKQADTVSKKTATKTQPAVAPESAAAPAASIPDPRVEELRLELTLREQELAKSNKEVERLKGIVRKIQEASRRESLVFHYNMAAIYRASVMYKKSEEEYLKALAIEPNDAGVHYNLAILYDDNFKDKKKAKLHYQRFLELAPEDPDAPKVREWIVSIL